MAAFVVRIESSFFSLQIRSSEEGLLYEQGLASTYGDVCCWWVGPWYAVIRIFHPAYIKPVLFASGRHPSVHSLLIAEVSVLPPAGQVTQVQTGGAVVETPLPLSHLNPHLPISSHVCSHLGCAWVTSSGWPSLVTCMFPLVSWL